MMSVVRMCLLKIAIGNDSFYYGRAYLLSDLYYNARPTRYKKIPQSWDFYFVLVPDSKSVGCLSSFFVQSLSGKFSRNISEYPYAWSGNPIAV